jgi:two-component system nitrate/nitrite response regulator NarL
MDKIRLFILDDHQMLIDGIKALLKFEKRFEITGESTKGSLALEMIRANTPDIVLTDIQMPDISGIDFTKSLKEEFPELKILALSMFGNQEMISAMLEAGVSGYVLKNTGKEELVNALLKIAAGGMFFSDEVSVEMALAMQDSARRKPEEITPIHLTEREKEILKLISKEFSNAQIAEKLFISERTVETHRKNIFRKTGTKGLVGLMRYAMIHHLID